jgi:hypothetical protein
MKAYNTVSKYLKAMSLVLMTLILANCGKSDNGGSAAATNNAYVITNGQCYYNGAVQTALQTCQSAAVQGYGWYNGACYQVGGGVYNSVATTSCAGITGYQMINGQCYQMVNGAQTVVNYSLCTSSTVGGTQLCNGLYQADNIYVYCQEGGPSYATMGNTPYGYGYTMDCSGLTLMNSQTYTRVTCQ